jgi:CYTH domain-containing protein
MQNVECERKFLLTADQCKKLFENRPPISCSKIFQGYFYPTSEEREFRVRVQKNDRGMHSTTLAFLTLKEKVRPNEPYTNPMVREEIEVSISPDEAKKLIETVCEFFISKKKYYINGGKDAYPIEVHVFSDGRILAEIEFANTTECLNYTPDFEFEEEMTYDNAGYSFYTSTVRHYFGEENLKKELENFFPVSEKRPLYMYK